MAQVLCMVAVLCLALLGCVRSQPEYVVITATPVVIITDEPVVVVPPDLPDTARIVPTDDPVTVAAVSPAAEYVVQAGDTLSGIAAAQGVTLQALLEVNALLNPNILSVGQVIFLPGPPGQETPALKIIPDSRLVRAPGSSSFDIDAFVRQQPGYIRVATDAVNGDILSAAKVVERVALEYSVDARLLLALLELRGGWLSNPEPDEQQKTYPLGAGASPLGFDRNGLYRQLTWGADQLNRGYYGWKYGALRLIEFEAGERLAPAVGLNAATVAVQFMLSQFNTYSAWTTQVGAEGLYRVYGRYFGDPFDNPVEPIVPADLEQPELTLPFPSGESWFYTGGPHGGWGAGSAWAAVDFAPPDDLTNVTSSCYLSNFRVTAVAPGVIARSGDGSVILDLDGDGDEATGWTVLYLHVDRVDRIAAGTRVETGTPIGRPSCEGGFSNGTHVHIARRYNGEWIPADCSACTRNASVSRFVMSDWRVVGIIGQEYQGYLVRGGEQKVAEQGRLTVENVITW